MLRSPAAMCAVERTPVEVSVHWSCGHFFGGQVATFRAWGQAGASTEAAGAGLEPAFSHPKCDVLPLHHPGSSGLLLLRLGAAGRALKAAYTTLYALPEGHFDSALLGAIRQDARLQGGYLPSAGGALRRELPHGGYGNSASIPCYVPYSSRRISSRWHHIWCGEICLRSGQDILSLVCRQGYSPRRM